jgi:hypothetical protein
VRRWLSLSRRAWGRCVPAEALPEPQLPGSRLGDGQGSVAKWLFRACERLLLPGLLMPDFWILPQKLNSATGLALV